jgi:uncharacterized protein (TIGR02217 family)
MTFHDVQFPVDIALNAKGGPQWRTEVVALASGREERNSPWANARHRYDIGYGIHQLNELELVTAFFNARRGRRYGFRFKDWADFKSCGSLAQISPEDQEVGFGDGSLTCFYLTKLYTSGSASWNRSITKPIPGSVRVAVAGVEKTIGSDFSIDALSGAVTFLTGSVPAQGELVSAGFEFDVPVRFDADYLPANLQTGTLGAYPDISLVEVVGE